MKEPIYNLDQPEATDSELVGVRAAQIAHLRQRESRGQPGFVVTVAIYRTAPHGEITPDVEEAIAAAYAQLGDNVPVTISSSPTREDVPVVSFEGVTGCSKIITKIESCWQSFSLPEARDYFTVNKVDASSVEMGVLIQAAD